MQFMNDDMEELFRDAAKDYPLKTDGADWNKVLQQLQHEDGKGPDPKKENYRRYLWLLLLLPIAFICTQRIYNGDQKVSGSPAGKSARSSVQKINDSNSSDIEASGTITQKQSSKTAINNSISKKPSLQTENETSLSNPNPASEVRTSAKAGQPALSAEIKAYAANNNYTEPNQATVPLNTNKKINRRKEKTQSATNEPNGGLVPSSNQDNVAIAPNNNSTAIADTAKTNTAATDQIQKIDSASITANSNIKKQDKKQTPKGFYSTILLGPDVSTVKFERLKSSGYSVGIMLGYQFSTKIAVEAGLLWDHKNYYSSGEYFNTSKIAIPAYIEIKNVTGSCGMIEIPLNIKYFFAQQKQSNWFMSTGISSYLMKTEDYTYLYNHNNVQYDAYKNYKNSATNWFSILNISAGYQRNIRNVGIIGIEPYIKLPLQGVGIGKLPITSTGVYLSISRPIFK